MTETMLAAVFKSEGKLVLEERTVPTIRDSHDVLLEVKGVGVCGTDLHILEVPPRHPATPDVIMGHEFCGRVLAVGDAVMNCAPGDHIAVDQNAPCGHCSECRRGFPNDCITAFDGPVPGFANTPGIFYDGALAKYIVIPDFKVYRVSTSIPWHHLAITETVACAFNAVRKAVPEIGETAVVLGAGPVGLLLVSMLKRSGVRVISSEIASGRREMARKVGADVVVDPAAQDLAEVVSEETAGNGAEIVMEAVGPLFDVCVYLARFGGRVVLFGHDELARPIVPPAEIVRKELEVKGVFLAKNSFVPVIQLLERDLLPMDDIVTHVMPLAEIHEAHRLMRAGDALKVVIDPGMG
jgi:threonine dehydrogenase-like Zn-dependent dehydrogenase